MKINIILRTSLFLAFSSLFTNHVLAQTGTGTIQGLVKTVHGKPAEFVNAELKGTTLGDVTDASGEFTITNVQEGDYTLTFSFIGLETKEVPVRVLTNQITKVPDVILKEDARTLNEIVITQNRTIGERESGYIAKMPVKNIENPQVYNVVNKELMTEQITTSFDDAVKNVPGLDKLWESTGRSGDGAGYYSLRGFSVQSSMVNGIAGQTNGGLDPANLERIEVIKGPSGTLFGSSLVSFGGLINLVTKKPFHSKGGHFSYTAGGYGLNRFVIDYNTPLTSDKSFLFRINSAYHYENSFQDAGYRKSFFVAPSISFQANKKLSFLVNLEYFVSESTNPLMLFLNRGRELAATKPSEMGVDFNRSYTSNDVTIKNPTINLNGEINYEISNRWTSQTAFSTSNRRSDGYYQYVMFIQPGDSILNRYVSDQESTSLSANIQQNFTGDFLIAGRRNRVLFGLDYFRNQNRNSNSPYILFDELNVHENDPNYTGLSAVNLATRFGTAGNPAMNNSESNTYSAYASDVINFSEKLLAMLSIRVDHFDNRGTYNFSSDTTTGNFSQTALSPKFGLVYQIVKDKVSIFGNYMNGFKNVPSTTQPDGTVSNFTPQQAFQAEGGIKVDLINGKLSGSLSYYDILVTDVLRPDPEKPGSNIQDGNITSKGFEADIIATPVRGLNIVAGYSFNESNNAKADSSILNRRPVSSGPAHMATAWVSYTFTKGKVKGFGIGAGGNYASENVITNSSYTGKFTLPEYAVVNGTLFYNQERYRLGVKVDNAFNEQYFKGWTTVNPQMRRRVSANLTLKF